MKRSTANRIAIFFLSLWITPYMQAQSRNTVTFYVATNGQPGNPGTLERPFQRPEQALAAVAAIKGAVNATIYFRGGNYSFTKPLTLSDASPDDSRQILLANYQNEKVAFTGGQKLDNSRFQLVSDAGILNRLPAAARGKVYQIDLKAAQITDYGKRVPHGYKNIRPAPLELFYNEKTLPVARYPNEGLLPIGTVSDPGSNPRNGDKDNRGATFTFDDARIKNWQTADQAWVGGMFSFGYSDDNMKVAAFDPANRSIRLKDPALYSVYSSADASNGALKNAQGLRGFYVYNLLEEIDSPGEWYLDEATGILYLWPPDNGMSSADIEVSLLQGPIMVLSNVAGAGIKGITFEYGRTVGLQLQSTRNTIISHCTFNGLGTVGISTSAQGRQAASNMDLLIQSCTIHETGTGGIILEGGDRKNQVAANNVVDNCTIYDYSRLNWTYSPAVSIDGVGEKVTHCDIHDAPDQAILFYGNDITIAYNHIYRVMEHMTDAGSVYTGRDPSTTGNLISNNFFENITNTFNASICAVYLDDGSSGMEVDGNVFYHAGTPGTYNFGAIHVNGGSENYFRNNEFVECHQAFSNSQWNDQQWKEFISNPTKRVFADIDQRSDAFTKKYPYLKKIHDTVNLIRRQNYSFNTLTYNVAVLSGGASYVHKNAVNTTTDPGFADVRNKNFTLNTVPSVLKQAGDWKPIPFGQIGRQEK
jgi:hypothetical protein